MDANINKQGVWTSGGINGTEVGTPKIWEKVNPNLCTKDYSVEWKNGVRTVQNPWATIALTDDQIRALAGQTYTFSYDLCRTSVGIPSTVEGVGWGESRFGIHLSLTYTNTSGATINTYPCADALTTIATGRMVMHGTFPADYVSGSGILMGIQPFAQPDNDDVWYIKRVKFEIGDVATAWTPAGQETNGSVVSTEHFYEI